LRSQGKSVQKFASKFAETDRQDVGNPKGNNRGKCPEKNENPNSQGETGSKRSIMKEVWFAKKA